MCTAHFMAQALGRMSAKEVGLHTLRSFKLERYFARHEFSAPYLLCCSDTQPLSLAELLELADEDSKRRWSQLQLGYTEAQGLPALREAIAASPAHYTTVSASDLVICVPQEGVLLAMLAVLRPGDRLVATYPGYQSLHEIGRALGAQVDMWEVKSSGSEGLHFDVADLLRLLGDGESSPQHPPPRMVVVNFPHNPTGWLPSRQQWAQIVEACRRAGCYLFSDEMYRGMEFEPGATLPAGVDCYEKAISLCGMSKAVGLPGLRVGWLASHDATVISRVCSLKDYTTICSSAPSEVLALAGVRAWAAILARQLATVRANLALAEAFFAKWAGVLAWEPPRVGTIAFPRLLTGEPVEAFCDRLVAEAGVLLLPATVYDHEQSVQEGRFRLGLGRADLPQCLEKLDAFLAAQQQQQQQQQRDPAAASSGS